MARVDFRVASAGVKPDTKVLLTSQGSDIGAASGDLFNQGGVLKFHDGTASRTVFFTNTNLAASQLPAFSGDATSSAGTSALTLATVNSNVGSFGAASTVPVITVNAKGLVTAVSTATVVAPAGTLTGTTLASGVTASSLTSVGTLTSLTISGDLAVNGSDITTTGTGTATVFNTNALTLNIGGAATTVSIGAGTGTTTVNNNLTVTGNLTVNGTTTTVNATTVTVDDVILTLGGDTAPASDDNKDRGIEFRWHNGTVAKVGFFGYDDSTGKFTFIPDATNTSEVFSGTKGTLDVGSVEASTLFVDSIEVDTTGATTNQVLQYNGTKFAPATITSATNTFSTVAVSGQSNIEADSTTDTLTFVNGTGITITTNATTDSVTVTNSGVTSLTGTNNQVTVSASTGAVTLSLPQNIHTAATPRFDGLGIGVAAPATGITVGSGKTTLATSVTGAASLNIVSGTAPTAPVSGDIWVASDLLNYRTSGGATKTVAFTDSNITGSAASWTTSRTITLGGDLSGSVSLNGTADVTLTATIAANSVALGTDTTGNYVASLVAGTGVTLANNTGESATPTISIGQAVGTTDSPTFAALSISDGTNSTLEDLESTTLTTTTATAIDTLSATTYRSAKFVVQAVQGTNYMITEILAVHDGTNVSFTEFGTIVIGTAPASFDVDINTGNLRLLAAGASSSSTVYRVRSTAIPA